MPALIRNRHTPEPQSPVVRGAAGRRPSGAVIVHVSPRGASTAVPLASHRHTQPVCGGCPAATDRTQAQAHTDTHAPGRRRAIQGARPAHP